MFLVRFSAREIVAHFLRDGVTELWEERIGAP